MRMKTRLGWAFAGFVLSILSVESLFAAVPVGCQPGSGRICLAVKTVVFLMDAGIPVLSQNDAENNILRANELWAQCGIGFRLEVYLQVHPREVGLPARPASFQDMNQVRATFQDSRRLLIATTEVFDRTGPLSAPESVQACGWTAMPRNPPYGVVIESLCGFLSPVVAHELGHFLGLVHDSDPHNIMNPRATDSSTVLSPLQCARARQTASESWRMMER